MTGRTAVAGWLADALAGVSALKFAVPTFIIADDQVTERADYTVLTPEGEQGGTSETIWHKQPDGSWKVTRLIVT